MNIVFFRYFLAVVETSNFTTAAERCHVTQPTLSAGIARLEEEVGARLFDRGRRTTLTMAGQRLLPHARTMLDAWHLARAESRSSGRQRLIRLAIGSTLAIGAAMQWLEAAKNRLSFDIEILEGHAEAVAERWRRGRCNIALFPARQSVASADAMSLVREPYVLAAAINHRIATRDRWSIKELADTPFVLRADCEVHEDAQRRFAAEGVQPRAVLRSANEERCAAAVLAGLGISLMPRSLLRPGMAEAAIREISFERRVMLAWHGNAHRDIVDAIRDAATGDNRLGYAR